MFEILKNMFRRKSRTSLTVFGIVIGIFALLVMGSLAEKMNLMISGGVKYYTGQITLAPKGQGMGSFLDMATMEKIGKMKGVRGVSPTITMMLADEQESINFGMPPMVIGMGQGKGTGNLNYTSLGMSEGRMFKQGERNLTVVGCDLAKQNNLKVGSTFKIKKHDFKVVGIIEKTLTAPDKMAMVPLEDARKLFIEATPILRQIQESVKQVPPAMAMFMGKEDKESFKKASTFDPENIVTGANVTWTKGTDAEKLAKRIQDENPDLSVMAPKAMEKQLNQAMLIFNLIITGSALIALVVGGLSVINTMTMSVSERTKEIGLKKALGARTSDILKEYLTEAGLIGLLGGLIGVILGGGFVTAVNSQMAAKGADIFLVTPRLLMISLLFAAALGSVSGIYPAARAAGLDCVKALKEE